MTDVYRENYDLRKELEACKLTLNRLQFKENEKVELVDENNRLKVKQSQLEYRLNQAERERGLLALAITESAQKAGILVNGNIELSGPQLLFIANDMAECINALTTESTNLNDTLHSIHIQISKIIAKTGDDRILRFAREASELIRGLINA